MKKILGLVAVIVLSAANAFAVNRAITVPTLSEWGTIGVIVLLGLVGVFFLIRRRKHGCCS